MFRTKTRTTIVTLIAACSLATATVAPAVSQAEPPEGEGAPVSCSYNGESFAPGERISVFSGAHYDNYYCGSDGEWHKVEHEPEISSVTLKKLLKPIVKKAPPRAVSAR
jgi:hypothetical protein